ncbi:MAG: hypothetical protein IT580_07750 [Verrucomicrobiales bacterium]|nr:hypothetical protein [Verrucomicrobiales bacterium]
MSAVAWARRAAGWSATTVAAIAMLAVMGGVALARGAERERGAEVSSAVPPVNERGWFKLVTPNFELFSNARVAESRRLLREVETFRQVVSGFLGLTNVQRRPALLFYFEDDASFSTYKPLYEGKPRGLSGFHAEDPLDYAMALSRQEQSATTMRVLFHEYTHLLTTRQFRYAPIWANEGVAEVFSTFAGQGDHFDLGVALTNHVHYLQQNRVGPVARLLGVDLESKDYNEDERAGQFYATSWLLAHYQLFGRRGFETNVMARYAALSASMTNRVEAFRRAFGATPGEVDAALKSYLKGGSYTIVRQTVPELAVAKAKDAALSPGELEYALGRLLQLVNRREEAKVRLRRAMSLATQDPRPREALALLAWREGNAAELQTRVDEALRLGSGDPFLHYLAAEGRYQAIQRDQLPAVARRKALEAGRDLCQKALDLDPLLATAHHLMGVYALALNPRAPAVAEEHVRTALRVDPQLKQAQLTMATLQAGQGRYEEARRLLAALMAGPLSPELRELVKRVAAEVELHAPPKRAGSKP